MNRTAPIRPVPTGPAPQLISWTLADLLREKGDLVVSVCIPARDEGATIDLVVERRGFPEWTIGPRRPAGGDGSLIEEAVDLGEFRFKTERLRAGADEPSIDAEPRGREELPAAVLKPFATRLAASSMEFSLPRVNRMVSTLPS